MQPGASWGRIFLAGDLSMLTWNTCDCFFSIPSRGEPSSDGIAPTGIKGRPGLPSPAPLPFSLAPEKTRQEGHACPAQPSPPALALHPRRVRRQRPGRPAQPPRAEEIRRRLGLPSPASLPFSPAPEKTRKEGHACPAQVSCSALTPEKGENATSWGHRRQRPGAPGCEAPGSWVRGWGAAWC